MSIYKSCSFFCIALIALSLHACGGGPAKENSNYATGGGSVAGGGLIAPLDEDSSAEIVSWVDRKPVTDWPAEIAKRDHALQTYLEDDDAGRAEKYGFRQGQNPRLAWNWFRENPVGFNGVPFVLLKTILDLDPDHENLTLRVIARIWKREASVPLGSGAAATKWTLDHIGVGPTPADYADGV